ncbi:Zn-dependent exopeptidase [Acrodontium crateriforme]|uniref:Zn-dependent exopeptidase n=1 Tax=Acrodontium crateriforme TaxID=150365 RepID=A0AAQ3R9J5_9PEZI|nr:Zn-dependent exopeptidase [Acrodontium crateriforme]
MKLSLPAVAALSATASAFGLGGQRALLSQQEHVAATKQLHLTHDLFGLHRNLTQIESISGNEAEVGQWLAESLQSQGYSVEKQFVPGYGRDDRFNILAWPGKTRHTRVLLSSHIDTVPPFYDYDRNDTSISGRGSVDAKASVAAQIIAANNLLSQGVISPSDIALLFVIGEEVGGDGMRAANDLSLHPSAIVFGEPTEGTLVSGHKGNLGLHVKAIGKAAHSGYPWLGRSANEVIVSVLATLMKLADELPESDKYGSTTINLGRIEGGVAGNVVAQDASAQVTIRIAAGTPADIKKAMTKAIHKAVKPFLNDNLNADDVVELTWTSDGYGPVDIDADIPGFKVMTVNYGTDVPNFKMDASQKRYLYGPGSIMVAHSDHEALTPETLEEGVKGYEKILKHLLIKE